MVLENMVWTEVGTWANGGVVIAWNRNVKTKVVPVVYESYRVCAITVDVNEGVLLLICVYMLCNDRQANQICLNMCMF